MDMLITDKLNEINYKYNELLALIFNSHYRKSDLESIVRALANETKATESRFNNQIFKSDKG